MKYKLYYISLSILALFIGIIFFMIEKKWIIFQHKKTINIDLMKNIEIRKKNLKLVYWNRDKWNYEDIELLWTEDKAKNIKYLIDSWLTILDEDKIMTKKVTLQDVALDSSGQEAILSFDRNPLNKENPTYEKLMWIEGLLKTIRDNNIQIQRIRFLVHHQTLNDNHLDFSSSWNLYGFLE